MGTYKPIVYVVPDEEDGWLLKTVLSRRMHASRKLLSRLKLTEHGIMVNGSRCYTSIKLRAGDRIELHMEEEESEDIMPQPLPLDILHEDDSLLVLNKPAGIIVHPTHGHYTGTLANGVVHYWKESGVKCRFRPIHRLDQDTSGVLAVAKTSYVHQFIAAQMIAGEVWKEYEAIVDGIPQKAEATIDAPIDRDPQQPHVRIVTAEGYSAVTHYRMLESYRDAALLRLRLETGRTHQIRVHLQHIGHAIYGDKMYGPLCTERHIMFADRSALIGRQALHAALLRFRHPETKQTVQFTAPLPDDMQRLRTTLTETSRRL